MLAMLKKGVAAIGRGIRKFGAKVVAAGGGMAVSALTFAQTSSTMDVSASTTYLSGTVAPAMAAVGGGIVGLAGIALGWRWVKATFF